MGSVTHGGGFFLSCFTRLSPTHHPTITRTDPPPPAANPSPSAGDKWTLTDAKGEAHTGFDWLIVSSAAPEALAPLVGAAKSIGSADLDKALGQVQAGAYKPNLALMLGYTGERAKAYAAGASPTQPISPTCRAPLFPYPTFYARRSQCPRSSWTTARTRTSLPITRMWPRGSACTPRPTTRTY